MGHVDRTVLSSYYQQPGDIYQDGKTEGAFETVAQAIDANHDAFAAASADGAIATVKLANLAVTRAKIAVGAVGRNELDPSLWEQTANNAKFQEIDAQLADIAINVKAPPVPLVGAKGDGVTDDTQALKGIVDYIKVNGVRRIYFPSGTYLFDELIIDNKDNILIYGSNATIFKARSDNKTLLRISASQCQVQNIELQGNNKAGCTGLGLIPADETQTTTIVHQNYNKITDLRITGFDNGLVMRCGPKVGAEVSGCYYNEISKIRFSWNKRDVWLRDGVGAGAVSPVNRNQFSNVKFGQGNNTGLQIDAGDTNSFMMCNFEGCNSGITPNATPTAIKIKGIAASGYYNSSNTFISCFFEYNTFDLENDNLSTGFFGCNPSISKMKGTYLPRVLIPYDTSVTPFIIPGANLYNNSDRPDLPPATFNFLSTPADNGLAWKNHTLTTTNMTNVKGIEAAYSKVVQLGKMVDWHFRIKFKATTDIVVIDIDTPIAAESNMYADNSFMLKMKFSAILGKPVGQDWVHINVVCEFIANNKIRINLPPAGSAWTTWSTNDTYFQNEIHCTLRYRAQ